MRRAPASVFVCSCRITSLHRRTRGVRTDRRGARLEVHVPPGERTRLTDAYPGTRNELHQVDEVKLLQTLVSANLREEAGELVERDRLRALRPRSSGASSRTGL